MDKTTKKRVEKVEQKAAASTFSIVFLLFKRIASPSHSYTQIPLHPEMRMALSFVKFDVLCTIKKGREDNGIKGNGNGYCPHSLFLPTVNNPFCEPQLSNFI
jgi:hypothetical protein